MKRILVPVDFSDTAWTGACYAAGLAKTIGAELQLLHATVTARTPVSSRSGVGAPHSKNPDLSEWQALLQQATGSVVSMREVSAARGVADAIAALANDFDLVVMGTNGAESSYQRLMGSHTYQVIEHSKSPVLFIPDGVIYEPITRITYAYDPRTNAIFLVEQLQRLAADLNVEVTVLHIAAGKPSALSEQRIELLRKAIDARQHTGLKLVFRHRSGRDVMWEIHSYMQEQKDSVLAMSWHRRPWIARLFSADVVEKISRAADYPVFVFRR